MDELADSSGVLHDPAALTSAEFNRIPYLVPLRALVRRILGPRAFSYPAKVLRAIYPEQPGARTRGRYVHHDYAVTGVQDMLTTWIPLMGIPVRLGGLAVRPGGPGGAHPWPGPACRGPAAPPGKRDGEAGGTAAGAVRPDVPA